MSDQDSLFKQSGGDPAAESGSQKLAGSGAAPGSTETDLALQLREAQRQIGNLVVFLLVVSGTLAVFLLQQVRYARADLSLQRLQSEQVAQAEEMISKYMTEVLPAQQRFLEELGSYAQAHPDVIPILAKHGLVRVKPATPPDGSP